MPSPQIHTRAINSVQANLGILDVKEIMSKVFEVFADRREAVEWLNKENNEFKGKKPIEVIKTSKGQQAILKILNRIEHNIYS